MENQAKVCNVCGNKFDMWDEQENFGLDTMVGYGSKYDETRIQFHICCSCFDTLYDKFKKICVIPPYEFDVGTVMPSESEYVDYKEVFDNA